MFLRCSKKQTDIHVDIHCIDMPVSYDSLKYHILTSIISHWFFIINVAITHRRNNIAFHGNVRGIYVAK